MSVVVYGPQSCGKTTNAEAIAGFFGLSVVVDEYAGGELPKDALALTNVVGIAGALIYDEVITMVSES